MIPFGGFVFHLLYCIFMSFFLLATWLGRSYFLIRDWTTPPTEEAWHTNQWTARQVPHMPSFVRFPFKIFAQLKNLVICILILIHIFGWGMWYKYFVPVCGLTFWFLNGPLRKVLNCDEVQFINFLWFMFLVLSKELLSTQDHKRFFYCHFLLEVLNLHVYVYYPFELISV